MATEEELRKNRCCFTGHRPEKLEKSEHEIKDALECAIRNAIAEGYTTFITGMARGVDIWAAEVVLWLRSEGLPIRLICASPYYTFESGWSGDWQARYNSIIKNADLVKFISPAYSRACFQKRNEWMVDHSSLVIAVFNGEKGGTRNTIEYAGKKNVPVRYV